MSKRLSAGVSPSVHPSVQPSFLPSPTAHAPRFPPLTSPPFAILPSVGTRLPYANPGLRQERPSSPLHQAGTRAQKMVIPSPRP